MTQPVVVVAKDAAELASLAGDRLLGALRTALSARPSASVVLSGGRIGTALLAAAAASPHCLSLDWSLVDVWWGDERFVPPGGPERNEDQARAALLDRLPLDPTRVHPMPARVSPDADPHEAAERYRAELLAHAHRGAEVPEFDVVLLGMGAEGHTASIFPGSPAAYETRSAFAVLGCPKPPSTRLSLSFDALSSTREVWMVVSGAEKAPMVAAALGGAGRVQVPAIGPRGRTQTLWLLDEAAASQLPRSLRRG